MLGHLYEFSDPQALLLSTKPFSIVHLDRIPLINSLVLSSYTSPYTAH